MCRSHSSLCLEVGFLCRKRGELGFSVSIRVGGGGGKGEKKNRRERASVYAEILTFAGEAVSFERKRGASC